MKTWIIVLTIVFVVLKLIQTLLKNYIQNNKMEAFKYYYSDGGSTLGFLHGLFWLLSTLVGFADAALCLIYIVDKI